MVNGQWLSVVSGQWSMVNEWRIAEIVHPDGFGKVGNQPHATATGR
jgi:hypothetical protein